MVGHEDAVKALLELIPKRVKRGIRKGSRAGCKIVQAYAKTQVPVVTGLLRSEIKIRSLRRSRRFIGTQVTIRVAGGKAYYGSFVELGTKKMAPRGFLKKSAPAVGGGATKAFIAGILAEVALGP